MKILILSDKFPPQNFNSAYGAAFDWARALRKAGHQVFVITTCRDKSEEENFDYQGLKVFRIFANYHDKWQDYLSLYNPQTVKKVEEIIKEIKPDIVHAYVVHGYLSYYCLKIAKHHSKAVFLRANDVMLFNYGKLATEKYLKNFDCRISWLDRLKQAGKRSNPLRNILIKRYLKYVDKIFAVSNALKDALKQNGIKNTEISHTGIDVDDWRVNPEIVGAFKKKHNLQDKKVIFFGGRISALKGLEQINRAMIVVKKIFPEAVLLISGSQGVGWLNGDELKAAYHSADIVVVPSVCFDAFPRNNLEAMACKKPVVATCYGGSPEIVQDGITGFIVNPFNVDLMAERIIDLLKNPEKAKQLGEAGFKRVKERFSLDVQAGRALAWYQKFKSVT